MTNPHFGPVHTCRTLTWYGSVCLVRRMYWQDTPVTIWNMPRVHIGEVRPTMDSAVCLGALTRSSFFYFSSSRWRSAPSFSRSFVCDSLNDFTMVSYLCRCVMDSQVSSFLSESSTKKHELCKELSLLFHHQLGCENPHELPQSVSESIVLTHLCVWKMHSTPGQSMTWLSSQHSSFPLRQIPIHVCIVFVRFTLLRGRVRCDGCGTILPITGCVRQWRRLALLHNTFTVILPDVAYLSPRTQFFF